MDGGRIAGAIMHRIAVEDNRIDGHFALGQPTTGWIDPSNANRHPEFQVDGYGY
jgi:hypothetical protein